METTHTKLSYRDREIISMYEDLMSIYDIQEVINGDKKRYGISKGHTVSVNVIRKVLREAGYIDQDWY